jgi:isochorismate hydrolase
MKQQFTPEAKALWQTIPPDKQELLLNTVWCRQCAEATTITDFTGREVRGDLILTGICAACGETVTRVIETSDPSRL